MSKLRVQSLSSTVLLSVAFVLVVGAASIAAQTSPKIASAVNKAVEECREVLSSSSSSPSATSNGLLHISATGEIALAFHAMRETGDREEADLQALGGRIITALRLPPILNLPDAGLIEAWMPYDKVNEAAELSWVVAVTPPAYGDSNTHPLNPINSEGVPLHRADVAQTQGYTGAGVTVGIISVGATSVALAQARNELPPVTIFNTSGGDEGTAMLEIVHDMAPGANLLYDDGAGTDPSRGVRHANALANLAANGADVIAEDLAFDSEPAFQQGLVAAAREATAALGVAVHSSSGNRGTDHAARVPAVGTGGGPDGVAFGGTPPGCTNTPDNVVAIAPGGDTTFDVTLGQTGSGSTSITLQWSEPRAVFPTAGQGGFTDLNLYVMDAALTTCLAESVGVQANGVGDTIEQISVDLPGTAAKIVVDVQGTSTAVAAPLLDLRWRNMQGETDATTRAGSNDPDKNYTGLAYSIGAVRASTGNLEGFSSAGPVNLVLTTVCPGGAPGPCAGVAGPAPQNFQGLDFLGADAVSVSGEGGFGSGTCPAAGQGDCTFSGTSASAPHTAACEALVREIMGPGATSAEVRARMAATAIDFPPDGEDSVTGAGLVDCFAALGPPTALCTDVEVSTDPGLCTASVASIDDGSSDPFGDSVTLSQSPDAPYALGDTSVDLTATDSDGLFDSCSATVTVVDEEVPQIDCNAPPTIVPPDAPISFTASATDNCGVATVEITEFDCFKFTKKGKRIDKTGSCEVSLDGDSITILDSGGVNDNITWTVEVTDDNGNTSSESCALVVVNPGQS